MNENLNVQFGKSSSADFEEGIWTFEMKEGFYVKAGEFAILPKDEFENIIKKINKETSRSLPTERASL